MGVINFESLYFNEVVELLKHAEKWVRVDALMELEMRQDPRAVPHLVEMLGREERLVRPRIVEALGNLRDPRAVQPLVEALQKDPDMEVKLEIPLALAKIGSKNAVPILRQVLKHPVPALVGEAIKALYFLKDSDVIPTLETMLTELESQSEKGGDDMDACSQELKDLLAKALIKFKELSA